MAVLKKRAEDGTIPRDETVVCYVTGNGLKAADALRPVLVPRIRRSVELKMLVPERRRFTSTR